MNTRKIYTTKERSAPLLKKLERIGYNRSHVLSQSTPTESRIYLCVDGYCWAKAGRFPTLVVIF